MAKKKTKFCCQSCGYESPKWLGRCPGCGEWNSFVEEIEVISKSRGVFQHSEASSQKAVPIVSIETQEEQRFETSMVELNRVLGAALCQVLLCSLAETRESENPPFLCSYRRIYPTVDIACFTYPGKNR